MNFFKSVFSADPEPSDSPRHEEDDQDQQQEGSPPANPNPSSPSTASSGGAWGLRFGGLIKTIASRSESVMETYRRDLEEFGTGLKKETSVVKEVASRAVRDIPVSLEAGASVAQESLETVGKAIDDFGGSVWRGTADIISHGKDALLAIDNNSNNDSSFSQDPASSSKRYSRFGAQVLAIQNDANAFVEMPENCEDFEMWRAGFSVEEKEEEIEGLLYDNGTLEGFYERFVPNVVDRETFWARYFYRVYRLKQAEDARAKLVKRVIEGEEEEELSWEVDDSDESGEEVKEEEEEEKEGGRVADREIVGVEEEKPVEEVVESLEKSEEEAKGEGAETSEKPEAEVVKEEVLESSKSVEEIKPIEASQLQNMEEEERVNSVGQSGPSLKMEEKLTSEAKPEPSESGKDSDFSVISRQPSVPGDDDDLGWDEIGDLGEHEDKKVACSSGSPKNVDLRKRLSVAEDDQDLSWDIEDDDEPAKP